jgi:HAMP domain-containing protein
VSDKLKGAGRARVGGRRARTDVARAMVFAALLSVILLGAVIVVESRAFLVGEVEAQLEDVGASRLSTIDRGLESIRASTVALAAAPSVGDAVIALSDAFDATSGVLNPGQQQDLEEYYRTEIEGMILPGLEEPVGHGLFPVSDRAQYLQYWYIAENPFDDRADLDDPGDGSPYSEAHATHHPFIREAAVNSNVSDFALLDDTGNVVYTVQKRIDFATNLLNGEHSESVLGQAISDLASSAVGEAILVDLAPYAPASSDIEMWVVTLVRTDSRVVGAIASAIPADALTAITTADEDWEGTGLGETGEVYIVGSDGRLRTESRLWLEDPEQYPKYLSDAGYAPELADRIELFDTTVLLQPVDTDPVIAAQQGIGFSGDSTNYLNQSTLSIAGAVGPVSLGWVGVAEARRSEINGPLFDYLRVLFIATIVLVVVVIAVASVAASRLLRPIDPIVEAASAVSEGNLDVRLPDAGRDEFAYLSGQFNAFVDELVKRRDDLASTEAETTELLASVVPRRLVDQVMAGNRDIAESMSNASLITFAFKGGADGLNDHEDLAEQNSELLAGVADLAMRYGAEQLSSSAATVVYATGLNVEDPRVEDAVAFALRACEWMSETLQANGFALDVAAGISAGDLVTGVVGTDRLTVGVLGAPRQLANALAGLAPPRHVLVDAEIAARLGEAWQVERVTDLEDMAGAPLDAWKVASRVIV